MRLNAPTSVNYLHRHSSLESHSCSDFVNSAQPKAAQRVEMGLSTDSSKAGAYGALARLLIPVDGQGDQDYRNDPQNNIFASILFFCHRVERYITDEFSFK
jgi:hypothetical protein